MKDIEKIKDSRIKIESEISKLLIDFINENELTEINLVLNQTFAQSKCSTDKIFAGLDFKINIIL